MLSLVLTTNSTPCLNWHLVSMYFLELVYTNHNRITYFPMRWKPCKIFNHSLISAWHSCFTFPSDRRGRPPPQLWIHEKQVGQGDPGSYNFWNNKNRFSKCTIKVGISCSWRVFWDHRTSHSTPDDVLVSLQFWKQCTRQVEGLWMAPCQLKKALKGLKWRGGSCWEERKRILFCFPNKGSLLCPPGKSMAFFTYLASLI